MAMDFIVFAGLGWIASGIVSLFVWFEENSSAVGNPSDMLYIGIFVIAVGLSIIIKRRAINEMMEQKIAKR